MPSDWAGHCRTCARQAGLLDHYHRVQDEEARLRRALAYARAAHRYALWALGTSGVGALLAVLALLTRCADRRQQPGQPTDRPTTGCIMGAAPCPRPVSLEVLPA